MVKRVSDPRGLRDRHDRQDGRAAADMDDDPLQGGVFNTGRSVWQVATMTRSRLSVLQSVVRPPVRKGPAVFKKSTTSAAEQLVEMNLGGCASYGIYA